MRCQAYTTKGQAAPRGGRHLNQCRRDATTERSVQHVTTAHTTTRSYHVCGTHAAMVDDGRSNLFEGYER